MTQAMKDLLDKMKDEHVLIVVKDPGQGPFLAKSGGSVAGRTLNALFRRGLVETEYLGERGGNPTYEYRCTALGRLVVTR